MISEKSSIIDKKSEVIDQQNKRIAVLGEYLRLTRTQRFGPSSEKSELQQEMLFNDVAKSEESDEEKQAQQALEELQELAEKAWAKGVIQKSSSSSCPPQIERRRKRRCD